MDEESDVADVFQAAMEWSEVFHGHDDSFMVGW
jgi:hypothetical protein